MKYKNILIIGGGGYVGTRLTLHLLKNDYNVTVLDTFWFGDFLGNHQKLNKVKGDIRDKSVIKDIFKNQDVLILLACLSNDPMADISPALTKQINYDAMKNIIDMAKRKSIKRLIFASSTSVYGIKNVEKVTEDLEMEPFTLYSKYKAEIEKVVLDSGSNDFTVVIVRGATVSGFSPRMRFDLLVNLFVYLAMKEKVIYLEGGKQIRPLIHISDIVDFYTLMINVNRGKIHKEAFNVSAGNFKVIEVAQLVKKNIPCEIKYSKIVDPRSYPACADKVLNILGYKPKLTIKDALIEVQHAIETNKIDINDTRCFNLKQIKKLFVNKNIYEF